MPSHGVFFVLFHLSIDGASDVPCAPVGMAHNRAERTQTLLLVNGIIRRYKPWINLRELRNRREFSHQSKPFSKSGRPSTSMAFFRRSENESAVVQRAGRQPLAQGFCLTELPERRRFRFRRYQCSACAVKDLFGGER